MRRPIISASCGASRKTGIIGETMTKSPKKLKPEEIETEPDGWDRFQQTMDKIVPPKRPKPKEGKISDK